MVPGRRRLATVLFLATGIAGCQFLPVARYEDTRLPPPTADLSGMTLVLVPTTVPDDLELLEARVHHVDSLIEHVLDSAGFDVVSASVYATLWDSLTQHAGGFFDPFSGERLEARYDSAVTTLFEILQGRYDPDGLLFPELWVSEATLLSGVATWDGHREEIDFRAPGDVILGLSLVVKIEDMAGTELFDYGVGVEVVETWDPVAEVFRLRDAEEVLVPPSGPDAVRRALDPLMQFAPGPNASRN